MKRRLPGPVGTGLGAVWGNLGDFRWARDNPEMSTQNLPPLTCQKHLFSIPEKHVWLNAAYMGPLPVPVQQAAEAAMELRAFPLNLTPNDFFEPAERVRRLCGQLVNAHPDQVALIPTTAYATATVARNLSPAAGENVVMLADQFPSNVHPWRHWEADGVQMRWIPAPDKECWSATQAPPGRTAVWNDALLAAIDDNTVLVAVEQAHWTDGTLFDLVRIGERCKAVNACFLVDATQTAGTMPLDFEAIGADALIVHSYKAMLCNYGLGFAAFSERFASGRPLEDSWLTRNGSEDFSRLIPYQDEYAAGMRRYDCSIRANPVLIMMLEAACELLVQWQPERIRNYLLGIEEAFVTRMRQQGCEVADNPDRAANIFGVKLPDGTDSRMMTKALAEQGISVSVRGSAMRVAPHVYNDEADLMRLADAVHGLL